MAALTGPLLQVPSSVSAIKVDGRRAYDRVRAGETVELAARPVTVSRFEIIGAPRRREGSSSIWTSSWSAPPAPTSGRWPGTWARRSGWAGTSPGSVAPRSDRSTSPTRLTCSAAVLAREPASPKPAVTDGLRRVHRGGPDSRCRRRTAGLSDPHRRRRSGHRPEARPDDRVGGHLRHLWRVRLGRRPDRPGGGAGRRCPVGAGLADLTGRVDRRPSRLPQIPRIVNPPRKKAAAWPLRPFDCVRRCVRKHAPDVWPMETGHRRNRRTQARSARTTPRGRRSTVIPTRSSPPHRPRA